MAEAALAATAADHPEVAMEGQALFGLVDLGTAAADRTCRSVRDCLTSLQRSQAT